MIRVLAVADEEVPAMRSRARDVRVDLVLGAGDLPWDYLEELASIVDAPAAFVPGNHDPQISPGTASGPRGVVNLDRQVMQIGGLRVAGLGGCVRYNDGSHQYTQREYDDRAAELIARATTAGFDRVDILLTHAPPLGLGDEPEPAHLGIEALHSVIETLQPTWHLHGHIHPYGMLKSDRHLGSTTIRNVIPWQVIEVDLARVGEQLTWSGSSGSPRVDAESDFMRARRHQVLSSLAARLRNDSDDAQAMSFDEVVDALGRRAENYLGTKLIPLDAIVGSVDKVRDFDRRFRPTSARSRQRWERLSRASRTGEEIPPIDVYQVGDYYFVRDGHHRVSVARSLGLDVIEARVTAIDTFLAPVDIAARSNLELKHWRRMLLQRVPFTGEARAAVAVDNPYDYGALAESIEAWATRTMHAEGAYMDPETMARRWYEEEFCPVVDLIEEAGVRGPDERPAEAYLRVAGERFRLIREHDWNEDVMAAVKRKGKKPPR
ncbi:metallophosphoesterase [Aeromicrobium sp. UC242_57]|uniref:metallophosphoesterase n=1 Tax=Aeromicrobium sp. UC242_57 TaxID=3374624 RepID=UPI0037B716B4